jgi:subtilisin family serine protease
MLSADPANELFVRFVPGASAAAVGAALTTLGATVVTSYPDGPALIALRPGTNAARALAWLRIDPEVSYAEPNAALHDAAVYPNDPSLFQQWGLNSVNNVDIDAPQAWGITQGSYNVIVAVLDTGIDLNNPEFAGRLWINPDSSGADGHPGDVFGWNFVGNNNNVQDHDGHGTHVAGILAASGNNGRGVAGVDWYARIMPVKVLDNSGNGTTDAAVSGIYFAVQHGARVINASWGGGDYSQAMADAIAYAGAHGVVFVTAAGNDGTNGDLNPSYPGSYRLSNEITVAAVDSFGNLASFSDYGARSVDLAAPGVNIWSTVPGSFASYSGTSMATPYVSGVAALILSLQPQDTAAQVVQRILSTTKPLPGLAGRTATGGIVDAYNAVNFTIHTTAAVGAGFPADVTLLPSASTHEDVLAKILATTPFYAAQGGTDPGFVTGLFHTLAVRTPDLTALQAWTGLLQQGWTRFQVAEAFERTPGALLTKVARWFQEVVGTSEPLGLLEQEPGVIALSNLLSAGQSDNAVLATLLAGDGYWALHGGTNAGFVSALFTSLLGRPVDPPSLSYYVGLLQGGVPRLNIVQMLQTTPEAKQLTVARWYQDNLAWTQTTDQLKSNPGVQYWAGFLQNG